MKNLKFVLVLAVSALVYSPFSIAEEADHDDSATPMSDSANQDLFFVDAGSKKLVDANGKVDFKALEKQDKFSFHSLPKNIQDDILKKAGEKSGEDVSSVEKADKEFKTEFKPVSKGAVKDLVLKLKEHGVHIQAVENGYVIQSNDPKK